MKVLWIINDLLPEAKAKLLGTEQTINGSGSWIYALAKNIINTNNTVEIVISSVSKHVTQLTHLKCKDFEYYVLPYGKGNIGAYNPEYENYWKQVYNVFKPDVVHIHGTEYTHGLSYVRALGAAKVVVSIQGLVSVIADYMYGGISKCEFNKFLTLHDLLARFTIESQRRNLVKRGLSEIALLQSVNHVIGRTTWDKAHAYSINPQVQYHYNGENIRDEFYDGIWDINKCNRYTIFMSQGQYPYKGTHQLLKALVLVKRIFPQTKLIIAGPKVIKSDGGGKK